MTLLGRVVGTLVRHGIPHALIGAGALAVHGVSRSTLDQDLLATDTRVLDRTMWGEWPGVEIDIRRAVDLVIGRGAWQDAILARATPVRIGAADLVLLKLYAGGTQDKWDIEQLLAADSGGAVRADVDARLQALPPAARTLWAKTFRL